MARKYNRTPSREIANADWVFGDGTYELDYEHLATVFAHATFKELQDTNALLRAQNDLLRAIVARLDGLGKDGLHTVIRYHRRQVATKNAAARAAAKARRQQS